MSNNSQSYTINDLISTLTNDLQSAIGIMIFSITVSGEHYWQYDLNAGALNLPDVSATSALFMGNSDLNQIILNTGITNPAVEDSISFYVVTSGTYTSGQSYNAIELRSTIYQNTAYSFTGGFDILEDELTNVPTNFPVPVKRRTLLEDPLSLYTAQEVSTAIKSADSSSRVVIPIVNDTIAYEVKHYNAANGRLPTFKNYADYIAYKNAISAQNYLLERYP